jgi:restriction system protein
MIALEIALGIVLIIAVVHFWLYKRKVEYKTSLIAYQIDKSIQMKRTLAMGLYLRFRKVKDQNGNQIEENFSDLFIKQNPIDFESFVAEVMEAALGGTTWVSPPTKDFGVDFEHEKKDCLYLGQVKCYKDDLSFDPIALIHSNMIKRNAKGGYVITTGSFTENARDYAKGLNIELIDGVKLVEYWLEGLEQTESRVKNLKLDY